MGNSVSTVSAAQIAASQIVGKVDEPIAGHHGSAFSSKYLSGEIPPECPMHISRKVRSLLISTYFFQGCLVQGAQEALRSINE